VLASLFLLDGFCRWLEVPASPLLGLSAGHVPELGALLVCEAGQPSRLVARMVDAGLLNRTGKRSDRRATQLSLTRRGRRAARAVAEIEHSLNVQLRERVDRATMKTVSAALWPLLNGRESERALNARYPDVVDPRRDPCPGEAPSMRSRSSCPAATRCA
jgi:DNA-binding MarR family transcriptional regulator